MLLYWTCLIVAGAVLVFSLAGGDHDADAGSSAGWGDVLRLLNLRALVSGVAFFGLAGVLAPLVGLRGGGQLLFAAAAGVSVAVITGWMFEFARGQELNTQVGDLVGRTGVVLVAPSGERPGKVRLNIAGGVSDLHAVSSEALRVGDQVIVIASTRGRVDVRRWDGLS